MSSHFTAWLGWQWEKRLNFSLRNAGKALDSEPNFVFVEISFDGYFWDLKKMSLLHRSLPFSIWWADFFILFCFRWHWNEQHWLGYINWDGCSVQIAPQDSPSKAPSGNCLLFPRRPIEGSWEHWAKACGSHHGEVQLWITVYNVSGYYGYLTYKWIELDSDSKDKNEEISSMNATEVAALKGTQNRLACI